MDFPVFLASILVPLIAAEVTLVFCYSPLDRDNDGLTRVAKRLRAIAAVFALAFSIVWLVHQSSGTLRTHHIARVLLIFNVALINAASLLEVTRVQTKYDVRQRRASLAVGLSLIACLQVPSIVFAAIYQAPESIDALARYFPPSSATLIQSGVTALSIWRPNLGKAPALGLLQVTVVSLFSTLLSIVPFWIWVSLPQEEKLAILGFQVCQLVLLNWPPAFSLPTLVVLQMGPKTVRKEFWGRVGLLNRTVGHVEDEVKLTTHPQGETPEVARTMSSRATSFASIA